MQPALPEELRILLHRKDCSLLRKAPLAQVRLTAAASLTKLGRSPGRANLLFKHAMLLLVLILYRRSERRLQGLSLEFLGISHFSLLDPENSPLLSRLSGGLYTQQIARAQAASMGFVVSCEEVAVAR